MAPKRIKNRSSKKLSGRRHGSSHDAQHSEIGKSVSGFDHYGYPIIRNMRLPRPYKKAKARLYGQSSGSIQPMKLVDIGEGGPSDKSAPLALIDQFRIKPSPSVPAAPDSLPQGYRFCVQRGAEGFFFRFLDPKVSLHGAEASVLDCGIIDDAGNEVCLVEVPGFAEAQLAPMCEDFESDKEPVPSSCCVRIVEERAAQIVCPGSAYDLLIVELVNLSEVGGIMIASVAHPDLPGKGVRLPVCEPVEEIPEDRPCCIEESTGKVICPEGIQHPLNGEIIPLRFLDFIEDADGNKIAKLKCGDILSVDTSGLTTVDRDFQVMVDFCRKLGGSTFHVCSKDLPEMGFIPFEPPPEKTPDLCCYDEKSGTLVCEGTPWHGLEVELVNLSEVGGIMIASVAHDQLPGRGVRIPVCPDRPQVPELPPADCCVLEFEDGRLELACLPQSHPWHGKDVSDFGECLEIDGSRICILDWEDELGRFQLEVPLCPASVPEDIPPKRPTPVPESTPTITTVPEDIPPKRPTPGPESTPTITPDPESIPPQPPKLPRPTPPPASGCEGQEASRCRELWDEMQSKTPKVTDCDIRWLRMLRRLEEQKSGLGCRGAMNKKDTSRRYGTGISATMLKYGRFPGLRGGRETI